jgi:hypothetical protein
MSKVDQPKEAPRELAKAQPRGNPHKSDSIICEVIGMGSVRNSGKDFGPGELVELSRQEADRAIALGCVKEA